MYVYKYTHGYTYAHITPQRWFHFNWKTLTNMISN